MRNVQLVQIKHALGQSMSRRGDCWDNAPWESWFGKLKTEWIYPMQRTFDTREEAKLSIMEYIEMLYNSMRGSCPEIVGATSNTA